MLIPTFQPLGPLPHFLLLANAFAAAPFLAAPFPIACLPVINLPSALVSSFTLIPSLP